MRARLLYRYVPSALAGLMLGLVMLRLFWVPPPEPESPPAQAVAARPAARPIRPPPPSFDIVRASSQGDLVMAGRAFPGATVTVLDDERPIGTTRADRKGEWVMVPDMPLKPGPHALFVRSDTPDGFREANDEPVVLFIPRGPGLKAVALGDDGRGRIRHGGVLISAVTRLGEDGLFLMGRGPADASIILYCDNLPVGEAVPDERGRWRLATRLSLRNGRHALRADQVVNGQVVASADAILEIGLPKLVSTIDATFNEGIDFEDGIPIIIEGGGRRLTGRTPGQGPSIRY